MQKCHLADRQCFIEREYTYFAPPRISPAGQRFGQCSAGLEWAIATASTDIRLSRCLAAAGLR